MIIENCNGDSGYYLEYFLGDIDDCDISLILDYLTDKTYLGNLLDTNLWHLNNELFKKYVYYKYVSVENDIKIDEQLPINEQISLVQKELDKILKSKNNEDQEEDKEIHKKTNMDNHMKGKKNQDIIHIKEFTFGKINLKRNEVPENRQGQY